MKLTMKNNTGDSWGNGGSNKMGVTASLANKLQNNANLDNKLNQFLSPSSSKPFQRQTLQSNSTSTPKNIANSPNTSQ